MLEAESPEAAEAQTIRKMFLASTKDIRVLLVKLADRAHNMRTLEHLRPERQGAIAQQTLDLYAPLAHRLGIYWLKSEFEDIAFRVLHPAEYREISDNLALRRVQRESYIAEMASIIGKRLRDAGIEADVSGRSKSAHSIHQKMRTQGLHYDDVHDVVAFRVLVDLDRECYDALGVVHKNWHPVPGRFRDYVALPKANRYQSLHTTVIGPYGERMEVQIRTHEMHRVAEFGIAAHWKYKDGANVESAETNRFAWLRQLLEWQQNLSDPQEFLGLVKEDLFSEEVFVFTPKGDVLNFPEGSSVVDFAYRIHSEVGHHCAGARVNGRLVPLRYRLRNGDTVEIVTTTSQTPSKDWLGWVKTSRATARRCWCSWRRSTTPTPRITTTSSAASRSRLSAAARARRSWRTISPDVGGKLPAMILTIVDFPAPLSPMRPSTSPGSSSRSTSVNALIAPKLLEILRRDRTGTWTRFPR